MSSVIVQVGQCGNQIGEAFWDVCDQTESLKPIYEHWDNYRRSVHIDSERKVVAHLLEDDSRVRQQNVICSRRGRGSNWALGYHGCKNKDEDTLTETAMEAIRKEVERCCSFSGFIMLHSMSGGTGSGLGSKVCELLRDNYGLSNILNCIVAPHVSGENPIQYYNALLCLNTLQNLSDGIVLLPNDDALNHLQQKQPKKSVSFCAMNDHIAAGLAGVFMPTDTLTSKRFTSIGLEPWEMIRSVCPNPTMKFLHIHHGSTRQMNWEAATTNMLNRVKKRNNDGVLYSSVANLFVARGDTSKTFPSFQEDIGTKVRSAYNCVSWNPFPVDFWSREKSLGGVKNGNSVTCVANSSMCIDILETVLNSAWQKFHAKAYLHHYLKHGCKEEDFKEAFETLQQVISDYTQAVT